MVIKIKKLKNIINNFLNEGFFNLDNMRYPCDSQFLKIVSTMIYEMKFGNKRYRYKTFENFYQYLKTIYPTTKISFEDALLILCDHNENFIRENDFMGSSTGVMQIKPQGILDAYRTEGARYYKPEDHEGRSLAIRKTASSLFKNEAPALSILKSIKDFLNKEIDGDKVLRQIEDQLESTSEEFIMFSGLAFLMMPGVNSITRYVAADGKTISTTRKFRHSIIRNLLNLEKDMLFNFTKDEILTKHSLDSDINPGLVNIAISDITKQK
jgi:hypothetical protein